MSKAEREAFMDIDLTRPKLISINPTPMDWEKVLKSIADCMEAESRRPPPPFVVSPRTFQQWKDEGLINEHPPGSDNWVFAFELEEKEKT